MILNDEMELVKKDKIEVLQFKRLTHLGVKNAFSLKGLDFMNREGIKEEYNILLHMLEIDEKNLVKPLQRHTDNILIIKNKVKQETPDIQLDYLDGVDGLITNKKNIAIATTSADCLCVVLYDPEKKVIANVHSGWRGTFQKIVPKALVMMQEKFGTVPEKVLAFFMPAIRQCHFEVEEDVMQECKKIFAYTSQLHRIIKIGRILNNVQKYNIDNIYINQLLLEEKGVLRQNMIDSGLCSVCHSEKIHSRRADIEKYGLATTIVMME